MAREGAAEQESRWTNLRVPLLTSKQWHVGAAEQDSRWTSLAHLASLCGRQLRQALAEQVAECGVSDVEFFLLWNCQRANAPGTSQVELAALVGVSPAQLSGLADRLRQRGLLDAQRDPLDRRRQYLHLTDAGSSFLQTTLSRLAPLNQQLDARLTPNQQQALEQLLLRIIEDSTGQPRLRIHDPQPASPSQRLQPDPVVSREPHGSEEATT